MDSFLAKLEKNKQLFDIADGEIIEFFRFSDDVYDTFRYLMVKSNSRYFKNCEEQGKSIRQFGNIKIDFDKSGKCYFKVIGNDNHTVVIIRQDDSNYEDYKNIIGTKITEEEFKNELDFIQKRKLEKLKISSRFLREEPLEMNICEEMNISLLISYYRYLNDYINPVVMYDEPNNTIGPVQKLGNPTKPRKNPIIALDDRKKELLKYNPQHIIRFGGNKTGSRFDAYIYERDGFILAVVEPESGIEYQYNLNLGQIDINDMDLIKEMVKAALEAEEEIVMQDDAIIRKNHTTDKVFAENLDTFLNGEGKGSKFYSDIEKSKTVYRR